MSTAGGGAPGSTDAGIDSGTHAVAPPDAPGYQAGEPEPVREPVAEFAGAAPEPEPGAAAAAEARWRRIRRWAGLGYLALIVVLVVVVGIPTDRGSLTLVVVAGLAIPCLGRGWSAFRRVLIDWLPFTAALIAYDYSRGLAKLAGQPLHVGDIADIDRDVFGVVPTVWLQGHYLSPGAVHWYDAAATLVYMTHFLATPVMAGVLWLRNRELWVCFVRRVLGLAVAGLATYILFPAAPPWYASRTGDIGLVVRGAGRGWFWLHINHAGNLLQEGQAASNPVAAMPSLHTGYATIISLFVLTTVSSRFAWAILLYPAAMAISLVYLGEHYVIDVVAGIVYAVVIHSLASWWERWRERSKERAKERGKERRLPPPDRDVRERAPAA
jgi:membrane-associated phospholipid phosphatase